MLDLLGVVYNIFKEYGRPVIGGINSGDFKKRILNSI